METRNLPLRVLYTINSSPQYILARFPSACPVVLVPPVQVTSHHDHCSAAPEATTSESEPRLGTTLLKTCLDAICLSSPELLQDSSRDFSVYVLDPLESNSAPAPVNISNSTSGPQEYKASSSPSEYPRGVAVGLGLMSWGIMADAKDSAAVTGTLIKLGTEQEALEVIFALRETAAMEKTSLPAALWSWGLPPQPSAQLSRVHTSKSHHEFKHPSSGSTCATSTSYATSKYSIAAASGQTVENSTYSARHSIPNSSESSTPTSPSYLGHISHLADVTTLATIASIQMRSQQKRAKSKAKKPVKPPLKNFEADRLLLSEDVYVGPVKKKGRPVNAIASGSGSNDATPAPGKPKASSPPAMGSEESRRHIGNMELNIPHTSFPPKSQACNAKSSKQSPSEESVSLPFVSTPLFRSPRDPQPPTLLDILAALSVSSSSTEPSIQNAALLAALNAIDSTPAAGSATLSEKIPNPALVNALRDLLSAVSQQRLPPPTPPPDNHRPSLSLHNRTHSPDDEVVLLDKENVNPTAFRRRCERDGRPQTMESSPPSSGSGMILGSGYSAVSESPPHNRGLISRSNGNPNAVPTAPAPAKSSTNAGFLRRKRTLSDVMDERESDKDRGKERERELSERRDAHRHAYSFTKKIDLSAIRHYPRLMSDGVQPQRKGTNSYYRTGMEPWTSPPRQKDENSRQQPIIISDSPQAPRVPATSPIKSKSTQSQARRRYVVPTWARTETSLQPRLSQEAQRALKLAEERKREERDATRKKGANRVEKAKKKQRTARSPSPAPLETRSCRGEPTDTKQVTQRPPPVTVASDYPVFALASAMQDRIAAFASPSAASGSNSPRLMVNDHVVPPRTPPRTGHSDLFSPGEDSSLFTPMPTTEVSDPCSSKNTPIHSQLKVLVRSLKADDRIPSPESKATAEDGNDASAEESEEDIEGVLNRELDIALQDRDMPSSSLPSVSSDLDMDDEIRPNPDDVTVQMEYSKNDGDDSDVELPKQHWDGLPPSSPPPPTSPLLMPQDEESDPLSDDMELPAATSDAEPWPTESEVAESSFSEHDLSACTDEGFAQFLKDTDFTSLFPPAVIQPDFGSDTQSGMDIFDRFTNHNAQPEGADQNLRMNTDTGFDISQNDLADLDFTEFWETFKPLVEDQSGSGAAEGASLELGPRSDDQTLDMKAVDHVRLAENVQALFSGCLM